MWRHFDTKQKSKSFIFCHCLIVFDPTWFTLTLNFWYLFFLYSFRVRIYHTIRHNQHNQTQWHKVNDFDFCFVSKCLHISNSRSKPTGLDFLWTIWMRWRCCTYKCNCIDSFIALKKHLTTHKSKDISGRCRKNRFERWLININKVIQWGNLAFKVDDYLVVFL